MAWPVRPFVEYPAEQEGQEEAVEPTVLTAEPAGQVLQLEDEINLEISLTK